MRLLAKFSILLISVFRAPTSVGLVFPQPKRPTKVGTLNTDSDSGRLFSFVTIDRSSPVNRQAAEPRS
jgi:hypothetical protein